MKQLSLVKIRRLTVPELVRERLRGFELRQKAREEKRAKLNDKAKVDRGKPTMAHGWPFEYDPSPLQSSESHVIPPTDAHRKQIKAKGAQV